MRRGEGRGLALKRGVLRGRAERMARERQGSVGSQERSLDWTGRSKRGWQTRSDRPGTPPRHRVRDSFRWQGNRLEGPRAQHDPPSQPSSFLSRIISGPDVQSTTHEHDPAGGADSLTSTKPFSRGAIQQAMNLSLQLPLRAETAPPQPSSLQPSDEPTRAPAESAGGGRGSHSSSSQQQDTSGACPPGNARRAPRTTRHHPRRAGAIVQHKSARGRRALLGVLCSDGADCDQRGLKQLELSVRVGGALV